MTVFLTTHYMEEAAKANHIAILNKGHLIEYGTPFSLKEKYAKDTLRLIPKEETQNALTTLLQTANLSYRKKENSYNN